MTGFWAWFFGREDEGFKRVTKPVNYGGGLTRMPDPSPSDASVAWASDRWVMWERGQLRIQGGECPRCYAGQSLGRNELLAKTHRDSEARARWRNHAAVSRAEMNALGPCRCGRNKTPDQGRQHAIEQLGPWL